MSWIFPYLRQAMVENGRKRAQETSTEVLVQKWISFLTDIVVPTYHTWCSNLGFYQTKFFWQQELLLLQDKTIRFWNFKIEGIQRRWQALTNYFN